MANKILYKKEALDSFLAGAKIIYDAVKVSYGPRGANVAIHRKFGAPTLTHDGVTIADAINIQEDDNNLGQKTAIELIKEASKMLNKSAGDGTSSVVILSYHIIQGAIKYLKRGYNPQELCQGIMQACDEALGGLVAEDVKNNLNKLTEVATISCADKDLGRIIAEVMNSIGQDGVISVEDSMTSETNYKIVEGYSFGRGYVSHLFINEPSSQECIFDNTSIVLAKTPINTINDIKDAIEPLFRDNKSFVIIANEIDDRVLSFLVSNNLQKVFKCAVVKAPSFADDRKFTLEDMEILLKADRLNDNISVGNANKIIIEKDKTTIIGGAGSKKDVSKRVSNIKSEIKLEKLESEKQKLRNRIAMLNGKVAVLYVGGNSDLEISQKRYRVDDAICAVRSAMEEGIVPGGGTTYIDLSKKIKSKSKGANVLKKALYETFRQLLINSEIKPRKYTNKVGNGLGIDVNDPNWIIDLKHHGIIDPAIVIKEVIKTSVSISATALTMGLMIVDVKEPIKYETND